MLISGFLSWIAASIMEIFMILFDTPIYGIAIHTINIFNGVARMDFFSTAAGAEIYTDMTQRIYAMIGIIMVFFFSYQMILMVINPDGKPDATSRMVRNLITSLIMIAFAPTLFHYMSVFQEHVLTEGTIMGIVTGTASGGDSSKSGKNTALIVYLSMFHPVGGGYQSLVHSDKMDENGDIVVKTVDECVSDCNGGASEKTCELWTNATKNFVNSNSTTYNFLNGSGFFGGITAYTMNHDLIETLYEEDGSEYYPIIILICGVLLAWFYISYTLDLGYRMVKLGFLQIIAPAPLIMRVFPKTEKTFEKWKHELIRTYLEIFARVAIVAFVLLIVQKIPLVVAGLIQSLGMSRLYIGWATVALILGLMKFGKELPKLVKDIFNNGSGLFSGIDWKPGVFKRGKAGVDEVIGYGKKIGSKVASGVGKVMTLGLTGAKSAAKVGSLATGLVKGAASAKSANPNATGVKKGIAMAVGAGKGASAAWNAADSFSSANLKDGFKGISNVISDSGKAASAAGSSVEATGLRGIYDHFANEFDQKAGLSANSEMAKIKAANVELVGNFNQKTGLSVKNQKIADYERELYEDFKKGGMKPGTRVYSRDADGNIDGEFEISEIGDIKRKVQELKQKAFADSIKKFSIDGNPTDQLRDALSALGTEGLKTHLGIEGLNLSDGATSKFYESISKGLNAKDIELLNSITGSHLDATYAGADIKVRNDALSLEIKEANKELSAKQLMIESIEGTVRSEVENDDSFRGSSDADKQAEINRRMDAYRNDENSQLSIVTKEISDLESKIANKTAEKERNTSSMVTIDPEDAKKAIKNITDALAHRTFAPDEKEEMEQMCSTLFKLVESSGTAISKIQAMESIRPVATASSDSKKDDKK